MIIFGNTKTYAKTALLTSFVISGIFSIFIKGGLAVLIQIKTRIYILGTDSMWFYVTKKKFLIDTATTTI